MKSRAYLAAVCLGTTLSAQGCGQLLGYNEDKPTVMEAVGGNGGAGGVAGAGGAVGGSGGTGGLAGAGGAGGGNGGTGGLAGAGGAVGGNGGTGGLAGAGGAGGAVGCNNATECPGVDGECQKRTCNGNTCGFSYTVAGTPVASQTTGDCQVNQCDGAGVTVNVPNTADVPVDGNQCTQDACSAQGVPSNPMEMVSLPCSQTGGTVCNGAGACTKVDGAMCGASAECLSNVCADGVCCNNACSATCKACNVAGSVGTCTNIPFGQDDVNASTTCSGTNQSCDGSGVCKKENAQACAAGGDCLSGVCAGSVCSAQSCIGLSENCGPLNENCCVSPVVKGGTYNRSNDPMYPATVSDFRLDRFEITVGRFRQFVAAYPGNKPASGAGAHPLIAGSGWNAAWILPMDQAELKAAVKCGTYPTWTDTAGANENLPMNCINWFESFAFCAWDGGRLPTEAEWKYAAAGGSEQRQYPWSSPPSSTTIDQSYAVYACNGNGNPDCVFADILKVGSKSPKGDGLWGQADLGGSIREWNLDWYQTPYATTQCDNCANLMQSTYRMTQGGDWAIPASGLLSSYRNYTNPESHGHFFGARCARTP